MELFDIITYIAAVFGFIFLLSILYEHWRIILLIVGIVLVNKFSAWASILIFVVGTGINLYDPNVKGRRNGVTVADSMLSALQVTVGSVIAAWFIGIFVFGI
ncbi:hypothetical protein ACMYQ1_09710 [Shewanella oncorhynchi]|uniref:hypothetical protein n=1 Tax=Shewanella oncorhynchi TaxID=2726434 RepID=UPI0039EEFAE9